MEETALSRHFSAVEIARLEHGLPRLADWSGKLLVPFTAHRLVSASVAWINRRWFLERGFDLAEESTLDRVKRWLLDEFAWCVRSGNRGFASYARTLWADRYGSSDGRAPHGGSGRVATLGRFQAKGIGQTPLVGRGAKAGHTHGCQSVAECLREAIWAEIAAAEFPSGAVPVVAVLDTGLDFSSPDPSDQYDQNVRRGIVIRPAVMRPAHAERAPLFKHPIIEFINRQSDDVRRTREVILNWTAASRANDCGAEVLAGFIGSAARQIAFGQVHRLFSGGYFSSNVSIFGELLDFGNMHALPNWSRAQVHSKCAGLGGELQLLSRLIGSLAFYFTKYQQRGDAERLANQILALGNEAYERAWQHYSVSLFQAHNFSRDVQRSVHLALRQYFSEQQRHSVKYRFGLATREGGIGKVGWLYNALTDERYPKDRLEHRVLREILAYMRDDDAKFYVALNTAVRLLMPRVSVDRRHLLDTLAAAVPQSSSEQSLDLTRLDRIVREAVSGARRYWARLPSGYTVLAHTAHEGSSALLCAQHPEGPRTVWLEGICGSPAHLHWFDRRFDRSEFAGLELHRDGAYWWAMCPARCVEGGIWHARLPGSEIALPKMDVWYPSPIRTWS